MVSGGPYTAVPITRRSPGHAHVKVPRQISHPSLRTATAGARRAGPVVRGHMADWPRHALAGCRSASRSHGERTVTSHSLRACRGHRICRAVIGRLRLPATRSEPGPCCLEPPCRLRADHSAHENASARAPNFQIWAGPGPLVAVAYSLAWERAAVEGAAWPEPAVTTATHVSAADSSCSSPGPGCCWTSPTRGFGQGS